MVVGHAHVGEEHLVERRAAGHLPQGPHLDTGRVHVDDEPGQALVLREVRVGAADDLAEVGVLRARRPHLLAVDHPLVAVALGLGLQAGEIGPRDGLAEQLATDKIAAVHRLEIAPLGLRSGVGQDRGRDHAEADAERGLRRRLVLRLDREVHALVGRRQLAAAVRGRASDPSEARVEGLAPPVLGALDLGQLLLAGALREQPDRVVALTPHVLLLHAGVRVGVEERPRFGFEFLFRDHVGHATP